MKIITVTIRYGILTMVMVSAITLSAKTLDSKPDQPLYINNVHIVDINTGHIVKDRQLKILHGKITAINPANTPISAEQYKHHNGNGHYVTPGLIDMHVHTYDPATFAIALSYGVTHLRLLSGAPGHLIWRKELEDDSRIGSTISVSSPIISGFNNAILHSSVHTPEDAAKAVIKAKQQGYDLIKAYGNLSAPVLAALLDEASAQNLPVAKHGPHPATNMPWNALTGLQSLEHVEDIYQGPLNYEQDQQKLDDIIRQLKALDIPITPTLNIFWQLTQLSNQKQEFIESLPKGHISTIMALEAKHNQVKRWLRSSKDMAEHNKKTLLFLQDITKRLYQAELMLLVGSDSGALLSPHGFATHNEMALMQQSGLPAIAILQAATINAAKALGKSSQLGQVSIGYKADLILSAQNPLETLNTLQKPAAVVKHGRLFSAAELEQLRENAIDKRSFWQELRTLSEVL